MKELSLEANFSANPCARAAGDGSFCKIWRVLFVHTGKLNLKAVVQTQSLHRNIQLKQDNYHSG